MFMIDKVCVVVGDDGHEYKLEHNDTYTMGEDIFGCNLIIDGLEVNLEANLEHEYLSLTPANSEYFSLVTNSESFPVLGSFSPIHDIVLSTKRGIKLVFSNLSLTDFDNTDLFVDSVMNQSLIKSTDPVDIDSNDDAEIDKLDDDFITKESEQQEDKIFAVDDIGEGGEKSPDAVKLQSGFWHNNKIIVWLRVKCGLFKHKLLNLIQQNSTTFYSIIFILGVILLAFIGLSGITANKYLKNKSQQRLHSKQADEYRDLTNKLKQFNITNLSVDNHSGNVVVNGIIAESSDFSQKLSKSYPDLHIKYNLYNLLDIQSNINLLEQQYSLFCSFADDYSAVNCNGVVTGNYRQIIEDNVIAGYMYEDILHMQLNLVDEKELSDFTASLLTADIYKNINYTVDSNKVILNGYISKDYAHDLTNIISTIKGKYPFVIVKNNIENLENILDIHIAEIHVSEFGNFIVDTNSNTYGVGSVYKGFTINAIQKNYIEVQKGNDRIYLPTPFTATATSNDVVPQITVKDTSQKMQRNSKTISQVGYSVNPSSSPTNIKQEEMQKITDDIVTKRNVLQNLQLVRSQAANDPKLQASYDKLITVLSDDLLAEEKEVNIYNKNTM